MIIVPHETVQKQIKLVLENKKTDNKRRQVKKKWSADNEENDLCTIFHFCVNWENGSNE